MKLRGGRRHRHVRRAVVAAPLLAGAFVVGTSSPAAAGHGDCTFGGNSAPHFDGFYNQDFYTPYLSAVTTTVNVLPTNGMCTGTPPGDPIKWVATWSMITGRNTSGAVCSYAQSGALYEGTGDSAVFWSEYHRCADPASVFTRRIYQFGVPTMGSSYKFNSSYDTNCSCIRMKVGVNQIDQTWFNPMTDVGDSESWGGNGWGWQFFGESHQLANSMPGTNANKTNFTNTKVYTGSWQGMYNPLFQDDAPVWWGAFQTDNQTFSIWDN